LPQVWDTHALRLRHSHSTIEAMAVDIEFLWFADCPSHPEALRMLHDVLDELGVDANIQQIEVKTDEQARELAFVGSPTIRVNGVDIDSEGAATLAPALTCRAYLREDGRISPLPAREWIRQAIEQAATRN
jgi:hypothetical protein